MQNAFANDDIQIESNPTTRLLKKVYVTAEDRLPQIVLKALGRPVPDTRNVNLDALPLSAETILLVSGLRLDPEAPSNSVHSKEHIEGVLSRAVTDFAKASVKNCSDILSDLVTAAKQPRRSLAQLEAVQEQIDRIGKKTATVTALQDLFEQIRRLDQKIADAAGNQAERQKLNKDRGEKMEAVKQKAATIAEDISLSFTKIDEDTKSEPPGFVGGSRS